MTTRASASRTSSSGMISRQSSRNAVSPPRSPIAARARSFVASNARWKAARSTESLSGKYRASAPLAYPASVASSRMVTARNPLRAIRDHTASMISLRRAAWSTIFGTGLLGWGTPGVHSRRGGGRRGSGEHRGHRRQHHHPTAETQGGQPAGLAAAGEPAHGQPDHQDRDGVGQRAGGGRVV